MSLYIRSFTLKDLSLESVLKHLKFFIYHKDRIPQRHIDFLHRLYSKECYKKYREFEYSETEENKTESNETKASKAEECLLWFLSSQNKNVFLPDITQNIVERLQIVGSGITSLTLQETMVTENVLNSVICCVPNLSYLDLSATNCSDYTLLCIRIMCPNLETLNVEGCKEVRDKGMVYLCGNSMSLKNLNIVDTRVGRTGLNYVLQDMPSLQCVTYNDMATTFHDIYKSSAYSNLNYLKFNLTELIYESEDGSNPKSVIQTWTVLCPNVEKVCILFPIKPDALMMCSRFLYLKEFEFEAFDIDGDLGQQLTPLLCKANYLTTLKLSYVKLPSVSFVECLTSVENLYLNDVAFTDFKADEIVSKTTNLNCLTIKNLDLNMTRATYKFIALLFALSKNVTELVISNVSSFPCDLVDIILNSMKNLIFFKFSLFYTPLPPSLVQFFYIPTIQRIYIDKTMDQNVYTILEPIHFSTDSCTLAWRIMNDTYIHDDLRMRSDSDYTDSHVESLINNLDYLTAPVFSVNFH